MADLRPGKTTVRHKPTGKLYLVDGVSPTGVALSGISGGRRVISREALNNNEVWEVTHQ